LGRSGDGEGVGLGFGFGFGFDWLDRFVQKLVAGIAPLSCDIFGILETAPLFGNTELFNKVLDTEGPLQNQNVCDHLQRKWDAGLPDEHEVHFAALHFYQPDLESLQQMDFCIVERIVRSPVLCLATVVHNAGCIMQRSGLRTQDSESLSERDCGKEPPIQS
jgi:hypothetical protein